MAHKVTPTQFKDKNGKIWDLKLTLGKTLTVDRSDFKIYTDQTVYLTRFNGDVIQLVLTDNALMFAVIGVIVFDQCQENFGEKLDDESFQKKFADSIDGGCIEPAREAFVEALSDFFPAVKTGLSSFLKRIREFQKKVSDRLPSLDPKIDQVMDETINREFSKAEDRLSGILQPSLAPSVSAAENGSV